VFEREKTVHAQHRAATVIDNYNIMVLDVVHFLGCLQNYRMFGNWMFPSSDVRWGRILLVGTVRNYLGPLETARGSARG
jgi:hypothetical protein